MSSVKDILDNLKEEQKELMDEEISAMYQELIDISLKLIFYPLAKIIPSDSKSFENIIKNMEDDIVYVLALYVAQLKAFSDGHGNGPLKTLLHSVKSQNEETKDDVDNDNGGLAPEKH